jgi:enolase
VGTLSETLDAMKYARDNDLELIVSHRSGEVEDEDFIADLAYAFNCFGLKTGAPTKKEKILVIRHGVRRGASGLSFVRISRCISSKEYFFS